MDPSWRLSHTVFRAVSHCILGIVSLVSRTSIHAVRQFKSQKHSDHNKEWSAIELNNLRFETPLAHGGGGGGALQLRLALSLEATHGLALRACVDCSLD